MDNTTSFNICVDSDILKQCEAMYGEFPSLEVCTMNV